LLIDTQRTFLPLRMRSSHAISFPDASLIGGNPRAMMRRAQQPGGSSRPGSNPEHQLTPANASRSFAPALARRIVPNPAFSLEIESRRSASAERLAQWRRCDFAFLCSVLCALCSVL
jgi:hypothetical protein